jgi:hypothetical protein
VYYRIETTDPCQGSFIRLKILTLYSLYIYISVTILFVREKGNCKRNDSVHSHNTKSLLNYHQLAHSDSAILPWYCNSCVQAKVIKKQEETILSLSRELDFAKTEISLLKGELNLVDNCPEEFRTVSNSQRKHKIGRAHV